jgi:hypothetical protein
MNTDNEDRPAPSRGIRLLCWFGIYVAAQLPLIPWMYRFDRTLWPLFPMGMEWGLICLIGALVPRVIWEAGGDQFQYCAWWVAAVLPWVTYVVHFVCTLCVRNRRTFLTLVWILIGVVLFNTASCAYFFYAPPE